MNRPFTDIMVIKDGIDIKNGTAVVSATTTGFYKTLDTHVSNRPIIGDIEDKYGYKFYNPIWVSIAPSGNISNI
jgi:hypothetical protein